MKTLILNVTHAAFDVMYSGEKTREYRKPSKWMLSRLIGREGELKKYDCIKIIKGYSRRPYFIAEYKGFFQSSRNFTLNYSNCLKVNIQVGDLIIKFGNIIERSEDVSIFKT